MVVVQAAVKSYCVRCLEESSVARPFCRPCVGEYRNFYEFLESCTRDEFVRLTALHKALVEVDPLDACLYGALLEDMREQAQQEAMDLEMERQQDEDYYERGGALTDYERWVRSHELENA